MQKRFFKIFTFCFLTACGGSGNEVIYSAPSFTNDYSVLSIKEGIRNIEIINASDTNNRDITLSISGGVDQEFFLIDINGQLSFIDAPDFESPRDSGNDNRYNFTIQATAGSNSSSLDVEVIVTDDIEPVANLSSWALDILPKSVNEGSGKLTATSNSDRSVTFSITKETTKGTLTLNNSVTGDFSYQTQSGIKGPSSDSFMYKVSDGFLESEEKTVNISLMSDILYEHQWHLDNTGQSNFASESGSIGKDINTDLVISDGYSGKGVVVAVVDSGLEINHEDLNENIEENGSYNFVNGTTDPSTTSTDGDHGTSVAGIIGASGWNNLGGRGVAPDVVLKGFNLLKDGTTANAISSLGGASYSSNVDIFNLSYGYETTASFLIDSGIYNQFVDGVTNLRSGRGANYVASIGNGFSSFGDANCSDANTYGLSCNNPSMDPEHSLPYLILVGALDANGLKASYSTAGSAIWISAPGGESGLDQNIVGTGYGSYTPGIMTTDQSSCDKGYVRSNLSSYENAFENKGNYTLNSSCNYTSTFKGSSAAAPVITGIIALLLEAKPNLTWRDIKHILASTANQIDPLKQSLIVGGYVAEPAWTTNSAGYKFHNWYGFGAVDTDAAITLAKNYTLGSLGSFITTNETSSGNLNSTIPDNSNDGVTNTIADNNNLIVESININVCLSHNRPSDLSIALTSPSSTRSVLLPPFNGFSNTDSCFNLISNAFYGESSNGNWSIKIVDKKVNTEGTINNWKITIFGR